jgi:Spy/CpxP family protein refolding chaperone
MTQVTFADLIEAAEQLPIEEQEDLIHILKNRLRDSAKPTVHERKRAELIKDVAEAQQEFAQGKCKPLTPEQIMEEILS